MNAAELSGSHIGSFVRLEDEDRVAWQGYVSGVEHGGLLAELVKVSLKVGSARVYVRCRPGSKVLGQSDFKLAVAR